jgi:fluoroquinolone resistance protein
VSQPPRVEIQQPRFDACIAARALSDALVGRSIVWPEESGGVEVRNVAFSGTSFRQAVLTNAHFVDCRFTDCSFRSSDLGDGHFERCQFYDADAQLGCDFSYAVLRNCRFEVCDLTTAVCTRTRSYGIELRRCQASGIDFSIADFSLGAGDFATATFTECNLAYADFSKTVLTGAAFTGSRMSHSVWNDAALNDADLSGCELDNIEARGLDLRGADLRDARFNRLDPREIDLTGVRLHAEQGLDLLRTLGIEID